MRLKLNGVESEAKIIIIGVGGAGGNAVRIAENGAVTEIETAIKKAEESSGYNVFLHISKNRAIERAKKVDSGEIKGSLAGVPFAVKDNFLHFDGATTAASRLLSNFTAPLRILTRATSR